MKFFDIFKLEDRVLFDAAGAAEIVEAAEAANNQPDPNAQQSAEDQKAQEDQDALKNAPPENPLEAQDSGEAQADPAEAADVDAQVEQLIQGDLPDADDISVDDSADIPVLDNPMAESAADAVTDDISPKDSAFIDGILVDNGDTISTDKELVVINSSVPDQDSILAELKPNQEVLILDEHNGLDEVQEYLDDHADTKYSAIHFVTHGNEGYISINSAIINAENVDPAEWAQIGEHLTDDGDILFYGCDTAKTTEGQQLMNTIADASGADVAASTDATGLAGDWDLEYNVGIVEHEAIAVESENINLTNYNVTSNADSGDGTFRWALNSASGGDEITFSLGENNRIQISSRLFISSGKFSAGLTIDGSNTNGGNIVFDGKSSSSFMYIDSGNIVRINDVSITNFYSTSRAAGITVSSSRLYIDNCLFSNNTAKGTAADSVDGVSITSYGSCLYVNNTTFSNNISSGYSHSGGIFATSSSTVVVVNSSFNNNAGASYAQIGHDISAFTTCKVYLINDCMVGNNAIYTSSGWDGSSLQTISTLTSSNASVSGTFTEVSSGKAVLNADGTFHIKEGGSADQNGVFIWHNGDYSAVAYSTTQTGTKTAVIGSASAATTLISTDQLGTLRGGATGKASVGAKDIADHIEPKSLIVTTTRDIVDATDNLTSLREAMNYAATLSGSQTITFNITDTTYAHETGLRNKFSVKSQGDRCAKRLNRQKKCDKFSDVPIKLPGKTKTKRKDLSQWNNLTCLSQFCKSFPKKVLTVCVKSFGCSSMRP